MHCAGGRVQRHGGASGGVPLRAHVTMPPSAARSSVSCLHRAVRRRPPSLRRARAHTGGLCTGGAVRLGIPDVPTPGGGGVPVVQLQNAPGSEEVLHDAARRRKGGQPAHCVQQALQGSDPLCERRDVHIDADHAVYGRVELCTSRGGPGACRSFAAPGVSCRPHRCAAAPPPILDAITRTLVYHHESRTLGAAVQMHLGRWGAGAQTASVGSSMLRQIVPGCGPTRCNVLSLNRKAPVHRRCHRRGGGGGSDIAPVEGAPYCLGVGRWCPLGVGRGAGALPLWTSGLRPPGLTLTVAPWRGPIRASRHVRQTGGYSGRRARHAGQYAILVAQGPAATRQSFDRDPIIRTEFDRDSSFRSLWSRQGQHCGNP